MCRPEPVSSDSPYADQGPKRLTAALSASGCQPLATDESGRLSPLRAAGRGGRREPVAKRPSGRPTRTPENAGNTSDLGLSMLCQISGQGWPGAARPMDRRHVGEGTASHPPTGSWRGAGNARRAVADSDARRPRAPRSRASQGRVPPGGTARKPFAVSWIRARRGLDHRADGPAAAWIGHERRSVVDDGSAAVRTGATDGPESVTSSRGRHPGRRLGRHPRVSRHRSPAGLSGVRAGPPSTARPSWNGHP
jgi:hypothetical protein